MVSKKIFSLGMLMKLNEKYMLLGLISNMPRRGVGSSMRNRRVGVQFAY